MIGKLLTQTDEEICDEKFRHKEYVKIRKTLVQKKNRNYLSNGLVDYLNWRKLLLRAKKSDLTRSPQKPNSKRKANPIKTKYIRYTSHNVLKEVNNPPTNTTETEDDLMTENMSINTNPEYSEESESTCSMMDFIGGESSVSDAYSFVGMHHLFCVKDNSGVTKVLFGHNSASRLGFCSRNGIIYVANVLTKPRIVCKLKGHTGEVYDFDWSSSNEYIISCAADKTVRIWNVDLGGKCIRKLNINKRVQKISFFPFNNNMFIVSSNTYLHVFNFSTGKPLHTTRVKFECSCICFSPKNDFLFVGDKKGYLHVYKFVNNFTRVKHVRVMKLRPNMNAPITSISYQTVNTNIHGYEMEEEKMKRGKKKLKKRSASHNPFLLINNGSKTMFLLRMKELKKRNGKREVFCELKSRFFCSDDKNAKINKSTFCPLISPYYFCAVAANKATVYVFDMTRKNSKSINSLHGHSKMINTICWNYNETLLSTGDESGTVILWKRKHFDTHESNK